MEWSTTINTPAITTALAKPEVRARLGAMRMSDE